MFSFSSLLSRLLSTLPYTFLSFTFILSSCSKSSYLLFSLLLFFFFAHPPPLPFPIISFSSSSSVFQSLRDTFSFFVSPLPLLFLMPFSCNFFLRFLHTHVTPTFPLFGNTSLLQTPTDTFSFGACSPLYNTLFLYFLSSLSSLSPFLLFGNTPFLQSPSDTCSLLGRCSPREPSEDGFVSKSPCASQPGPRESSGAELGGSVCLAG